MAKDPYFRCYTEGQLDQFDGDIDIDPLVERVLANPMTIIEVSMTASKIAINAEMDATTKAQWILDNAGELRQMGGDTEKAYRLYVQGRIDALAINVAQDIVHLMQDLDDEEDDDPREVDDADEDDDPREEEDSEDAAEDDDVDEDDDEDDDVDEDEDDDEPS